MALTDTFTRNIKHSGRPAGDKHSGGDVLTEAAAILTWLGAAHGKEGYARDTVLGRKEAEALSYMTSEVHGTYGGHFSPGNFAETEAAQEEVKRKTYKNLDGQYQRMNDMLSGNGGEWLSRRANLCRHVSLCADALDRANAFVDRQVSGAEAAPRARAS